MVHTHTHSEIISLEKLIKDYLTSYKKVIWTTANNEVKSWHKHIQISFLIALGILCKRV